MPQRFAIYFTPSPDLALYRRVTEWLGHSIDRQASNQYENPIPAPLKPYQQFNRGAAMYGFHATLKPPFQLSGGKTSRQLTDDLRRFAAITPSIVCSPLKIDRLGHFLALVPEQECGRLNELASHCVVAFDHFRSPSTELELRRRDSDRLSSNQRKLLRRWGYPYVMDEFRFHMTLTDRLSVEQLSEIQPLLQDYLHSCTSVPLLIDGLSLCRQSGDGQPFELVARLPLACDRAESVQSENARKH